MTETTKEPIKILSPKADVLDQARLRPQITGLRPKSRELIINTLLSLKTNGRSEFTVSARGTN